MKRFLFLSSLLAVSATFAAQYNIVPEGRTFKILRDGKVLVEKVESPLTFDKTYTFKTDVQTLKDGSKVWNFTSTDKRLNFRMEAALLDNGKVVEITSSTSCPAKSKYRKYNPLMAFLLNKEFYQGASYEGVENNHNWDLKKGKLTDPAFPNKKYWRWWTMRQGNVSVVFDINPIGPGDFEAPYGTCVCRGIAQVSYEKDLFRIRWPNTLSGYSFGGMIAGKLRIKDGDTGIFDKDHAMRGFLYNDPLKPQYLFSFGSKKHGKFYTNGEGKTFSDERKWGWVSGMPEKTVTTGSGAYYSHQIGKDGHFRMTGLMDGLHLVTFGAGNPVGTDNRFSVTVNGRKLLDNVSIGKDRFLTATLPLWIDNGVCDVKITGNYIVSSIASQFLLSNREDYSCRKGFWVTDGHETCDRYNNKNSKPYVYTFKPSVKETFLPPHGQEMAAPLRQFKAKRIPYNFSDPKNFWLYNARIGRVGNNIAIFEEMRDPKVMEEILDDELKKGKNTVMFSGLHSRHTHPNSVEKSLEYFKKFNDMAHKKGFKVINHHDTSLLWNAEAGFRVLAETLDGVNRSTATQLPGVQYCILTPYFKKQCMGYIRNLVKSGFDALQLDELTFVNHAGSCPSCREEFHKDTGWYLPVDETHICYHDYKNPMYRVFSEWKREKVGEWKTNIREQMADLNPNLGLTGYGTFALVVSPWGVWLWNSNMMKTGASNCLMGKESQSPNTIANARMAVTSQKFYNYFKYCFGIPVFTWCATWDWKTSYFIFCTCMMNAQLPLDYGGGFEDRSKGFMEFEPFEAHPDAMNRRLCREMAKLGVFYSTQTLCGDEDIKTPPGVFGFTQTLEELHIPHVYLGDDTLDMKYLKELSVLYIGSASCLSDLQISQIKKFAEQGGTVMMSVFAGTRDEFGKKRKEWPFAEIMGFSPGPKMFKAKSFSDGQNTVSPESGVLRAAKMSPVPEGKSLYTVITGTGKTLPGIVEKPYGKGKFLYSPVRMEELFYAVEVAPKKMCEFNYDAKMAAFYRNVLRKAIGSTSLLQTDAPEKVFMTLYREKDQVLVHLLNGTATGVKKGDVVTGSFKGEPFPALEKDITFTVPFFGKSEVFAVSPDFKGRKKLNAVYHDNGTVTVTLPKELLKGYTLVRIK